MKDQLHPRKLLLIAYHFPPIQGSTGTNRTVAFAKYLTQYGWDTRVLTIQRSAYEDTADENERLIPTDLLVYRAWGLDTRHSLSIRGKYPRFLALPDRWQSWIFGGTLSGIKICRTWRPDAIMTTYPIPSAHLIGSSLNRIFKIPWIAEFRDPMLQQSYPRDKWERWLYEKIENQVFKSAKEIVVTTEGCRQMYLDRFPWIPNKNITVVSNGYDPDAFSGVPSIPHTDQSGKMILLHSGLLYPHERNPDAFFQAICELMKSGFFDKYTVEFRFRASGNDEQYLRTVDALGIAPYVRILPRIPYAQAIDEMLKADALMIFQATNCNDQIPAKTYEYMYSSKPILAFADPAGDTGRLLSRVGVSDIAALENQGQITKTIRQFLPKLQAGAAFVVSQKDAKRYSRESLTGDLAAVLQRAIS